ncbi:Uncharacterised protein [Buttiauxella agrestis]|uniref:Uncharacterized protein n=1 Tax=Buttiauxella agrestis TaxID=82977 RepID=A0A381C5U6_9ENTR|nr:Uncharacterised protein [Buttiauxella agrestis]
MFYFISDYLIFIWLWVGGSLAVASVAYQTGRLWLGWFVCSILFTPLLSSILMCSVPHTSKNRSYGMNLLEESIKNEKNKL